MNKSKETAKTNWIIAAISLWRKTYVSKNDIYCCFRTWHFHFPNCKPRSNTFELVLPGKSLQTSNSRHAKNVPFKGLDEKRQFTGTFAVTLDRKLLPVQLIYQEKSLHCLPEFDFTDFFSISFTKSHWLNTDKSVEFFEEII